MGLRTLAHLELGYSKMRDPKISSSAIIFLRPNFRRNMIQRVILPHCVLTSISLPALSSCIKPRIETNFTFTWMKEELGLSSFWPEAFVSSTPTEEVGVAKTSKTTASCHFHCVSYPIDIVHHFQARLGSDIVFILQANLSEQRSTFDVATVTCITLIL